MYIGGRSVIYPKFSNKIDIPPSPKTQNSFFVSFSRNSAAAQSVDSRITPMLRVGKNIALSSRPASNVLSKLQQPKNAPTHAATVSLRIQKRLESSRALLLAKAKIEDIPAASKNAITRKSERWSAKSDFC